MRNHSAATHLAVLALLVAAPLLLLVGALLYRSVTLEQAEVRQRIGQVLEGLQADIDRDIDRRVAVLETLAASTLFTNQDWPAFHAQAREGLRGRGFLVLIDADGRQILNTSVPYGTEPRATGDLQTYERALQGGQPIVSDLFVGVVSRQPVFNVALPVRREGHLRWLLRLALVPEDLRLLLASQALPSRWTAMIWDGKGNVMASSADHARLVGTPAPAAFGGLPGGQVRRVTTANGERVLIAVARSGFGNWTTAVIVPAELVDRQLVESLLFWGLCTVAVLVLAIGLALLFGRALTRPLAAVTEAAGALGRGEAFVLPGSTIREIDAVGDALRQARRDIDSGSAALRRSEEQLRTAAEAARFGVHEYDVAADRTVRSPQFLEILGAGPEDSSATFEAGLDFVHPDDRVAVETAKRTILSGNREDYQLEYRIVRRDGPARWVMDRGRVIRDGFGRALRVVGVVLDISDIKEAEQRQRLLFDELSHRVKNTLAIVQALAQQTLRTRPEPRDFATAFSDRLGALARSHNLLTDHAWRGAALEDLVRGALSAFLDEGRCIDIGGDEVTIPASAAITLGLVMHELATNASKYGALSVPAGRLAVRWTVRDGPGGRAVDLQWTEAGGPPVRTPSNRGFGSRLLAGSAQQLGGSFEPDYAADGFRGLLRFTVAVVD